MINAYDFDKTIYDGDSSINFYLFCLRKNKRIVLDMPKQVKALFLYKMKKIDKTSMKEVFFAYLKRMNDIDKLIEEFWDKNILKIKKWYLEQKKDTDVIISASPEFLLKPLEKKLNIEVIASVVDKKTGKFKRKNCHDYEKIKRYEEKHKEKILGFYSDSIKSDFPMLQYAKHAYLVKKDNVTEINKKEIKNTTN